MFEPKKKGPEPTPFHKSFELRVRHLSKSSTGAPKRGFQVTSCNAEHCGRLPGTAQAFVHGAEAHLSTTHALILE